MTHPHYIDREGVAATCHKLLCDELGLHPDEAAESAGVFADAILALSRPIEAVAWREKVAQHISQMSAALLRCPERDYTAFAVINTGEQPRAMTPDEVLQALAVIPTQGRGE